MTRTSTRSIPLPEALIYDRDVNAVAVRMYGVYADERNAGAPTMVTVQDLANLLGVDTATIRRGNETLVRTGWITREVRANHALTTIHTVKRVP